MTQSTHRMQISHSLLGTTLAFGLFAVACGSSSTSPAQDGAGNEQGTAVRASDASGGASDATGGTSNAADGRESAGGSRSTGDPVAAGGAAAGEVRGTGGTLSGAGGSASANDNGTDSCVPESSTLPTNVPDIIHTPEGVTLIHHFHAAGTQNYKCTATPGDGDAGTTYAWVFVAPEAALSDDCGNQVGTHFAGSGGAATPRWQFTADGSFVQGVKVQASPVAGAIPELLLAATQTTAGAFADVTYVQRLATVGGAAPNAADCSAGNVDEVRKSGYSAEYYFYSGGADGGRH